MILLTFLIGASLFEPASTHSVIAGVLEWQDASLARFSNVHRKDLELDQTLQTRGVKNRTLLLDAEATTAAVTSALEKAIAATPAGGTLVFYYAGHGVMLPGGKIVFASYDISVAQAEGTGLVLANLPKLFERFKGKRVILLADCCYSGGLGAVAKKISASGIEAIALTSADDSNVSTGNWTFSQTVIDALNGRALFDRDANGSITIAELAGEVEDAMKHREEQRCGYTSTAPGALVVAASGKDAEAAKKGAPPLARGQWVTGPRTSEQKAVARILANDGNKLLLSFYDYSDESTAWVPRERAAPIEFKTYPVGASLDVLWNGVVYEAKVTKVENDFHFITYPGWGAEWDEWVGAKRIVGLHGAGKAVKRVSVEWKGQWWPAVLQSQKGGSYCIHYVGYDASWDECVPKARIKD